MQIGELHALIIVTSSNVSSIVVQYNVISALLLSQTTARYTTDLKRYK